MGMWSIEFWLSRILGGPVEALARKGFRWTCWIEGNLNKPIILAFPGSHRSVLILGVDSRSPTRKERQYAETRSLNANPLRHIT